MRKKSEGMGVKRRFSSAGYRPKGEKSLRKVLGIIVGNWKAFRGRKIKPSGELFGGKYFQKSNGFVTEKGASEGS